MGPSGSASRRRESSQNILFGSSPSRYGPDPQGSGATSFSGAWGRPHLGSQGVLIEPFLNPHLQEVFEAPRTEDCGYPSQGRAGEPSGKQQGDTPLSEWPRERGYTNTDTSSWKCLSKRFLLSDSVL